jgi:protein phosphatase
MEIRLKSNGLLVISGDRSKSLFSGICISNENTISLASCCKLLSDETGSEPLPHLALELMYKILELRLRMGKFTSVEIPSLSQSTVSHLFELCNTYYYEPYLVFCQETDMKAREHFEQSHREKGFHKVWSLNKKEILNSRVIIEPLNAIKYIEPPYDIIGDIHGCYDEVEILFGQLGYEKKNGLYIHPEGRTPVFLGDVADRGPESMKMISFTVDMVESGKALYVPGNHCVKFARWLTGSDIMMKHGVETTAEEYLALDEASRDKLKKRFINLVENSSFYLILDKGKLIVSHAGLKEKMIGREHRKIRAFCLFGATTGKTDANGFPERIDWAADYTGKPFIVYGHTPVETAAIRNNTINIDQGCVFGGSLTALRYPELTTVSVKSERRYYCRYGGQLKK